jgi:predicted transcriptional regulator
MKKKSKTQTAIRLEDELLAQVDKIAENMSTPGMNPYTRSEVIRLFVTRGVEQAKRDPERYEKKKR